jgi:uncharacterized protein (DUF58 family)
MAGYGAYGALLDAVRGVHWPARRAVSAGATGEHHSKMRGSSAEFTEYRLYRQGDDTRRLDWRLLARSDRAYIRLSADRAVLPTTFVLDTSISMAYPVVTRRKWTFAQELVVGLAAVAHAEGDPVGLVLSGRNLPPRTRRGVVAELARVVDDADPDDFEPLAPVLASVHTPRIVVVTDLLGDADALLSAAAVHVAAGGEVHAVHVIAREELDPPRRTVLAADPESPSVQRLLVESARGAYLNSFGEWRSGMARRWRGAGAGYTEVITDEPAAHAIRRIVA